LQTLEQKIQYCLERYIEARNSDIDLFVRLCENFYPPFESAIFTWRDLAGAMHSVPSMDHIARVRRRVISKNHHKKWLPTVKGIAQHRQINEEVWREYAKLNDIKEPYASNIPVGYDDEGNIK